MSRQAEDVMTEVLTNKHFVWGAVAIIGLCVIGANVDLLKKDEKAELELKKLDVEKARLEAEKAKYEAEKSKADNKQALIPATKISVAEAFRLFTQAQSRAA